ncbi:MAG: hypothetical protein H7Y38_14055 [Armatimonadetes bacterium]|nr:hypothetical protein [Armatimonadota bacterium]
MTLSITVPDTIATCLAQMPQAERDLLVTELLTKAWDAEDDLRERGGGSTTLFGAFTGISVYPINRQETYEA